MRSMRSNIGVLMAPTSGTPSRNDFNVGSSKQSPTRPSNSAMRPAMGSNCTSTSCNMVDKWAACPAEGLLPNKLAFFRLLHAGRRCCNASFNSDCNCCVRERSKIFLCVEDDGDEAKRVKFRKSSHSKSLTCRLAKHKNGGKLRKRSCVQATSEPPVALHEVKSSRACIAVELPSWMGMLKNCLALDSSLDCTTGTNPPLSSAFSRASQVSPTKNRWKDFCNPSKGLPGKALRPSCRSNDNRCISSSQSCCCPSSLPYNAAATSLALVTARSGRAMSTNKRLKPTTNCCASSIMVDPASRDKDVLAAAGASGACNTASRKGSTENNN
mmetsp:Transcript_100949/g.291999  ORF Transcript_100949/g.291999 Transcript_100949/m.291999 type:complete len:327 (+) Transcript_100949:753-1733(+)